MGKHTVLIVDDEHHVRNSLKRLLADQNYNLMLAEDGPQALELMKEHRVDLVIADERMPRMSGVELLRRVRENYPDTIRILFSGKASLQTAVAAVNEGQIYRFFTKPWSGEDIKVSIRRALEQLDLELKNRSLAATVEAQAAYLTALEKKHPGISETIRDSQGAIILSETDAFDDNGST